MSRVFWVRHAPTHAKVMVGWSDLPADLADTARLARLGAALPREALLVSSDLSRAVQTADAIAGARARAAPDSDLREIHFGAWELQPFDKVPDQARLRAFWEQPGALRPPGGESWDDIVARVNRAVARLMRAHPGRDLIVVAHLGAILTQVQRALGLSAYDTFAQPIDNLSITELHHRGGLWQVQRINFRP